MKPPKHSTFPFLNLIILLPALLCTVVILTATLISLITTTTTTSHSHLHLHLLNNKTLLATAAPSPAPIPPPLPTSLDHLAFGIASNKRSWPSRKEFVRLWWNPDIMRGCVYLDEPTTADFDSKVLPPLCVSQDTSRFRYTCKHGHRSAVRIARIVTETVNLNLPNVRWYVFGDDDTVFFPENLVMTLSKYDHDLWYYIGSNSEVFEQNQFFSFEMAFGGAGFAVSSSLAIVFAKVFDSCLERYPHLYGSDGRIASCLAELGVGLTHEPGFHQMDIRGDIFGLLASHPLTPLISLHHLQHANPIFPNKTTLTSLHHLFKSVKLDQSRILQKSICYDPLLSWTISVSWGYAVEIFDYHLPLPYVIRTERTFHPWKRQWANDLSRAYVFSTRPQEKDPCERSVVMFFDGVEMGSDDGVVITRYKRMMTSNCSFDSMKSGKMIQEVRVMSRKFELGLNQVRAMRRHCCDVLRPTSNQHKLEIQIRECKQDELTYMHT